MERRMEINVETGVDFLFMEITAGIAVCKRVPFVEVPISRLLVWIV